MRKVRIKTFNQLESEGFIHKRLNHRLAVIVGNNTGSYAVVKLDSFGKEFLIDDDTETIENIDIEEFKELLE